MIVSTPPQTVGSLIRAARLRAGLTQAELADRLGISRPSVAETEANAGDVTLARLERYAAALGVGVIELIPGPHLGRVPPRAITLLRHGGDRRRGQWLVQGGVEVRFVHDRGLAKLARKLGADGAALVLRADLPPGE